CSQYETLGLEVFSLMQLNPVHGQEALGLLGLQGRLQMPRAAPDGNTQVVPGSHGEHFPLPPLTAAAKSLSHAEPSGTQLTHNVTGLVKTSPPHAPGPNALQYVPCGQPFPQGGLAASHTF